MSCLLSFKTDVIVNGGDGVAAAALRDIEEKKVVVANNASKSTMIIHASRKVRKKYKYFIGNLNTVVACVSVLE